MPEVVVAADSIKRSEVGVVMIGAGVTIERVEGAGVVPNLFAAARVAAADVVE